MNASELNRLATKVLDIAYEVHSQLGPGLLESAYESCISHVLAKQGIPFERQKVLPLIYDGELVDHAFRIDLLVAGVLVLEIKAVDELTSRDQAQIITYLKLSGCKIGYLMNFNVLRFRDGFRRFVNDFPQP